MTKSRRRPCLSSLLAAALLLWNDASKTATVAVDAFSLAVPTIHSINNIPCREIGIYISSLDESITILEATLEGQEKLVDEVLMLEDEVLEGDDDAKSAREDPYGSVLWPAASAVSEHIARDSFRKNDRDTDPQERKPTLLELGTGTGLVALAASASGKYSSILATDYETVPLKLLDAAYRLNQKDNQHDGNPPIITSLFDICDLSVALPPADIVCAADILYEKSTGIALAKRTIEALERGSQVVIGCSPGRPGRQAFLSELQRLNSKMKDVNFEDVEGMTCTGERNSLICGKGSTSISDEPEMLLVALMDLTPDCLD